MNHRFVLRQKAHRYGLVIIENDMEGICHLVDYRNFWGEWASLRVRELESMTEDEIEEWVMRKCLEISF